MRLAIFYLFLFFMQSFWGAFLAPFPAPDLFLIAVLTLAWRIQPWQLILAAYGVGLFQDIAGNGFLGLHAFGLAGGAMAALLVRSQLSQTSFFEQSLAVLASVAGKWLAVMPLLIWQSGSWYILRGGLAVFPVEALFTMLFALWLLPWSSALMERTQLLRKELL